MGSRRQLSGLKVINFISIYKNIFLDFFQHQSCVVCQPGLAKSLSDIRKLLPWIRCQDKMTRR